MSKRFFVANWKMNALAEPVPAYCAKIQEMIQGKAEDLDVIVCPPFPLLPLVGEILSQREIHLGAQNCAAYEKGAYTGEVSASMLKDVGCSYVILGHSERRQYFHEENESLLKKVQRAQEVGLIPIICIGETLEEREEGRAQDVIKEQLEALAGIGKGVLYAYEPVWAIGTGIVAKPQQILEMHKYIAKLVKGAPVLYGGSVKPENAREILRLEAVSGVLVGGASLKSDEFAAILRSVF